MQVKLKKHASRVEEAVSLGKFMANHRRYEEMKKRLLEKYRFEVFDVPAMMDKRIQIVKDFVLEFGGKEVIIEHFFKRRSANFCLADLLLKSPYLQSEKRKCRYVNNEEENRSQAFVEAFYQMDLIDETHIQKIDNFEALCLLLEKIDIDREDKWLIQTTYLHFEEEMKKFVFLINQMVDWLSKFETIICEEEEAFYKYWSEIVQKINIADHLANKLNVDISRKTNVIWLIPAFFNCHGIQSKNVKDTVYVYMGMIFDESFSFEKKYETPELICSQLKLLSDPSKFEILCTIKNQSYYGSELAKKFGLSTPTISHHMRTLENAGFIKIEKKDNKTYYSLDHERLALFLKQVELMLLVKEE